MYEVKGKKIFHRINVEEPHISSYASSILLRDFFRSISRGIEPEYKTWLRFRKRYLKNQRKLNKGNLVCFFCKANYLDINFRNPKRRKGRKRATVDHILAQAKGGKKYDEDNFCVACRECNEKKADMDVNEFLAYMSKSTTTGK